MKGLLIGVALIGFTLYAFEKETKHIRKAQSNRTTFLEKNLKTECIPSEGYSGLCKITVGKYSSCNTRASKSSVSVDCKLYDELKRQYKEGKL